MRKHLSTIVLVLAFLIGLSLLLYPTVSDYWNSFHQSRAVATYAQTVSDLDDALYEQIWENAVAYNKKLAKTGVKWELSAKEEKKYNKQLAVDDTGMMSYLEIPKLNCTLPIYHGTEEKVLQVAIGHLPGTSLPVGGKSTHCVLSGHRGLPSAKLLTDLDKMVVGDTFTIRTLDEVLTYEVDQILIVLPDELDALQIEKGKDLCTLVTCTPYGINTHRLLVRGHRIESDTSSRVKADALQIEPTIVAPIVAVPILLILVIWIFVSPKGRKKM
ncbi:MAG: class C sortase [Eubacteriales bacterium]|nr:class C sortase [Eubacteriales bacterium]